MTMATFPEIRINSNAEIRREAISEDLHCVIVDDFLVDPHEIVEFAVRHADEFSIPENGYPGLLYDLDEDSIRNIRHFLRSKMTQHFPILKGGMRLLPYLSMATLQPDKLSSLQRVCHTDPQSPPNRVNYAALVYLFENEALGGTGFYRWRDRELMEKATAIEQKDPVKGLDFLQENFPTFREPAHYMTGSNEIAERLCTIPAKFNRLIFYSGDVPHSPDIRAPELLSTDFRTGRLTLNSFASVVPR